MAQIFKNNCASTLASGITDVATSMTLVSGADFPAPGTDWYYVTLSMPDETDWEIVKVTAKTDNTFTIVRAQESGADARLVARAWDAGARVSLRLTAGTVDTLVPNHVAETDPHPLQQSQLTGLLQAALDLAGLAAREIRGGRVLLTGGSAADPALRIGTAGIYSSATNTLSVAIAGVERLRIDTAGITVYGTITDA